MSQRVTNLQVFRDFALILLLYAIYAVVIVVVYDWQSFTGDDPPMWPIYGWVGSLAAILIWYVMAEWVVRPNAGNGTFRVLWFVLLAAVICCEAFVAWMELTEESGQSNAYPWLHVVGGIGTYYVASVLFSPLYAKYAIWPASRIRRW